LEKNSKIYLAGHNGLVGSAILRKLQNKGFNNIIVKTHSELDLTKQKDVEAFFNEEKPDYVFLAAAKVGGILANETFPAEFIYENIMIQSNIIHNSYLTNVKKLLFLGSSCIYPKECPQPIKEEYLMTGELEPTNSPYAIAKIAGIEMCWSYNRQYGTHFIPVMPTNLYGPNDNFDLETSHVMPALIRKFHEAKINNKKNVTIWGTGKPRREFLHVDDMADACMFLMNLDNEIFSQGKKPLFNIGTGKDIEISELAEIIKKITGFDGSIVYDVTKPDGTYQKLLDCSRINSLGWKANLNLIDGIQTTYKWYKETNLLI
jgi:GDP-L-fucose synthase